MIKLRSLVEDFTDDYGKNKWITLSPAATAKYAQNLADLIIQAYAPIGGNLEIQSAADLIKSDITYWVATDVDSDPSADAVVGGKQTKYGTKMTIMGQDGGGAAKTATIKKMIEFLKKRGFYAELDPRLAQKFKVQPITDQDIIKKILIGKELEFNTDGSYTRFIGASGKKKTKVMVGIPKII